MIAALEKEGNDEWAKQTLQQLAKVLATSPSSSSSSSPHPHPHPRHHPPPYPLQVSPSALKVTLQQMHEGMRQPSLGAALRVEYGLTQRFLERNDFFEGVRALLVDKDQSPKWNPTTLAEVKPADVRAYFAPLSTRMPPVLNYEDDFHLHKM